jgi:putative hydrolase of the HAD superfamily
LSAVRAVFFDAVGTLLHPEPSAAAVYFAAARRWGSSHDLPTIAARFAAAFRSQEEHDHQANLRTSEEREVARWRHIVAEVLDDVSDPESCFQELYNHFATPAAWGCAAGAGEVLAALAARGYDLGVASNFDHRLRGVVACLPELRPVRHLVISSAVGWRKPATEFFSTLCHEAGRPPEQILFVGDDPVNDFEGPRAAGLPALLFDPRGRCPGIPRIAALGELLERLAPRAG